MCDPKLKLKLAMTRGEVEQFGFKGTAGLETALGVQVVSAERAAKKRKLGGN